MPQLQRERISNRGSGKGPFSPVRLSSSYCSGMGTWLGPPGADRAPATAAEVRPANSCWHRCTRTRPEALCVSRPTCSCHLLGRAGNPATRSCVRYAAGALLARQIISNHLVGFTPRAGAREAVKGRWHGRRTGSSLWCSTSANAMQRFATGLHVDGLSSHPAAVSSVLSFQPATLALQC